MAREFDVKINTKVDSKELEEAVEKLNIITDENGQIVDIQTVVDDSEIDEAKAKEEGLNDTANEDIIVDDDQLDSAKDKIDGMNGETISVNVAMQNLSQGVSQAKTGFSELKGNVDEVAQAGTQMEQNFAFLSMNLGTEKATEQMQQISDIVASMPGDDNTMRSVLSTAQALGNNLSPQEMEDATRTMADYMSGSATMGKMATESQQDIMKYLLDGNTAELERGSIVSAYVDKLKGANTFQERQVAMQEVLNELGYGGISTQDTMLNKQAEWEGMIYNSQSALSSMWLDAEKGAMDYVLQLDGATNGLLGMGIVAGQMIASPLMDIMGGIGQIGTGLKGLKDANDILGLADKFTSLKDSIGTARTMVDALRNAESLSEGVRTALAIVTGAEAVAETGNATAKAGAVAPTTALAVAENSLLLPILLVIGAIVVLIGVLYYLYNNNETVRQSIDWLIATFTQFIGQLIQTAQNIASFVANSISQFLRWVTSGRTSATDLVNAIYNALVGLPSKISSAMSGVTNAITKPFQDAWGIVKPYVDKIGGAWDSISGIFNGFEGYEGFNGGSVGYEGFNGSLNSAIATASTSNNATVTNNFNINGIIEESASEYIVGAVNNHIKKQNLVRGV